MEPRFVKVDILSGFNNLNDISMHEEYSTIRSHTQNDLYVS